jgi:hypothetical protein
MQAAQPAAAILKSCRAAPLDAGFANPNVFASIPNGDYPLDPLEKATATSRLVKKSKPRQI